MKNLRSLTCAFALIAFVFLSFVFVSASPPTDQDQNVSTNIFDADNTPAVFFGEQSKAVLKTVAVETNTSTAPPVALPARTEQSIVRPFYGYTISNNQGKIPIRALNINAIGRREPDFIPLRS